MHPIEPACDTSREQRVNQLCAEIDMAIAAARQAIALSRALQRNPALVAAAGADEAVDAADAGASA
jgi:hypothetical protein